jgi:hypothetical protein
MRAQREVPGVPDPPCTIPRSCKKGGPRRVAHAQLGQLAAPGPSHRLAGRGAVAEAIRRRVHRSLHGCMLRCRACTPGRACCAAGGAGGDSGRGPPCSRGRQRTPAGARQGRTMTGPHEVRVLRLAAGLPAGALGGPGSTGLAWQGWRGKGVAHRHVVMGVLCFTNSWKLLLATAVFHAFAIPRRSPTHPHTHQQRCRPTSAPPRPPAPPVWPRAVSGSWTSGRLRPRCPARGSSLAPARSASSRERLRCTDGGGARKGTRAQGTAR